MSDEEYSLQRTALLEEKRGLEKSLQGVGQQVETCLQQSEQALEFACAVRQQFTKGDFATKKEIVATIGSNLTLKDKILIVEARKPFYLLETSLCHAEGQNEPIEPENTVATQGQKEACASSCPSLCPGEDSNLHARKGLSTSRINVYQFQHLGMYVFKQKDPLTIADNGSFFNLFRFMQQPLPSSLLP